jgi:hypothetical protein
MRSMEEIAAEILSLPSESRVFLTNKLVESLGSDTDSIIKTVWKNENRRRRSGLLLAEIDASIEGVVFQTEGSNLLSPFLWDVSTQGEFTIGQLLKSTENIIPIEIDDFLGWKEYLQDFEEWDEFLKQNPEYLTREETSCAEIPLHMRHDAVRETAERFKIVSSQSAIMEQRYLALLELLRFHITDLQVYKVIKYDELPIYEESDENDLPMPIGSSKHIFESFNILVGKTRDDCWIGISSISPYSDYPLTRPTPEKFIPQSLGLLTRDLQELEAKVKPILDSLAFVVRQFYDSYEEVKNYACEFAETEAVLIDRLLYLSNYLRTWEFKGMSLGEGDEESLEGYGYTEEDEEYSEKEEYKFEELDRLLITMLRDLRVHILGNQSIFDIHAIGRLPDGDWLGVSTKATWTG